MVPNQMDQEILGQPHKSHSTVSYDDRVAKASGKYDLYAYGYEDEYEFEEDFEEEEQVSQDPSLMNAVVGQYNGVLEGGDLSSVNSDPMTASTKHDTFGTATGDHGEMLIQSRTS